DGIGAWRQREQLAGRDRARLALVLSSLFGVDSNAVAGQTFPQAATAVAAAGGVVLSRQIGDAAVAGPGQKLPDSNASADIVAGNRTHHVVPEIAVDQHHGLARVLQLDGNFRAERGGWE